MIISENSKPDLATFRNLVSRMDNMLNQEAKANPSYYQGRAGKPLEKDVYETLCECSKGTEFQNTIHLISGFSFPDIVAARYYGVEVKSTKENHWTSTGSSILESTRDPNVERIFLTFGKLGTPVQFKSRPYEECMAEIAVTHAPRYRIDMTLKKGETIFDKMGIPYDSLRKLDNPAEYVAGYYKKHLKEGQSLWWAGGDSATTSPIVRLWSSLDTAETESLKVQGYVLFPEMFGNSRTKYERFSLWLVINKSVVNNNVRDSVSAGGQVLMLTSEGTFVKMPASFGRIEKYKEEIKAILSATPGSVLMENWKTQSLKTDRLDQWCFLVAVAASPVVGYKTATSVLKKIFSK